jgi:hypothetical protein
MKYLAMAAALFASTASFGQEGAAKRPKVGTKPPVQQAKPSISQGCKLVGIVRGTKLWAGDCITAERQNLAPDTPVVEPPTTGSVPPPEEELRR